MSVGKADANARRNEKFAQRNPDRIQKQIDDLKRITTSGGKLTKHEESVLEGLERDLKAVIKARESLGDRAPTFGRGPRQDGPGGPGGPGNGVLGKRRRGRGDESSDDSDVPDDVRSIPMPRDTPPPIPKEVLDQWYEKRRASRNANDTPLGQGRGHESKQEESTPEPTPVFESKTVYEAKPVVRDLRKEAVSAFMPTAVRMKMQKGSGQAGLMEPEEADQLEKEGYLRTDPKSASMSSPSGPIGPIGSTGPQKVTMEEVEDEG